ncbi:sensor histidine kinase [Clostridium magnum]|uniref:histidine kinase n=1 Tax=Clostridium magnum DSM 2767 TaxID=1121326 RepID=A0A161X3Y5_9CLOT|nr:sensor histidine kinase [Clostridium magnum]KZL88536.1 sensor histidine kinase GraS [Clostridium magnum DSM 2767]SHI14623.1 Signal transduction histidine kinase [Clostridium magnum DSM 2767]
MKLFLKDSKGYILIYFFSIALTLFYCTLMNYIEFPEILYIILFNSFILLCFLALRYYKTKEVYEFFEKGLNSIEESALEFGDSLAGKNISKLLKQQYKLYEIKIQQYNKKQNEHLTFVNQWVHQMKTPLSVIQLQLEEYAGDPLAESINEEISKMNKNLNLALHFARVNAFEKDFVIEKFNLQQLVLDTVNNDKKLFIKNKILPKVDIDKTIEIYTDGKWIKFVLEQIITNGIKYSKGRGKTLTIQAYIQENKIVLEIIDEGIGIPTKDIKRVFDPFFTGENGRKYGESTGMGLYIVKKVCENLEHKVEIESNVNDGTKLKIIFSRIE